MNNIHLLEIRKVEILAQGIRGNLASLRRLKMIRGTASVGPRDPSLDGFLDSMTALHTQLRLEIAGLGADADTLYQGRPISEIAGQVLADLDEMVDLLICLGAARPEDRENWPERSSV